MIFIWFFGIMVIFSIISGKDIGTFLATLGALSAVILLIFKDTILGFVASIQVTVNDNCKNWGLDHNEKLLCRWRCN